MATKRIAQDTYYSRFQFAFEIWLKSKLKSRVDIENNSLKVELKFVYNNY
jgi:hypothetical protein